MIGRDRCGAIVPGLVIWLGLAGAPPVLAEADHPELTAADEAYSTGNFQVAANLYRRDAELGVIAAQVNLAFLYLDGQGVDQDYTQAAIWFGRAAERGNAEAQQNLGVLYRDGKGVEQSHLQAYKWFWIAGAKADAQALEGQMTPEQIEDAKRLAAQFRPLGK